MVEFYRDEEKSVIEQANVERARAFSRLGSMLLRAPMRLAELGVAVGASNPSFVTANHPVGSLPRPL